MPRKKSEEPEDQQDLSVSSNESEELETPPQPVKRKRGRPRKNPEPAEEEKPKKSTRAKKAEEEKEAAPETEQPVKRKRGRPRKTEEQKAADKAAREAAKAQKKAEEEQKLSQQTLTGQVQSEPEQPVKRKRGRPRKVKVEEVSLEPVQAETEEKEAAPVKESIPAEEKADKEDSVKETEVLKETESQKSLESEEEDKLEKGSRFRRLSRNEKGSKSRFAKPNQAKAEKAETSEKTEQAPGVEKETVQKEEKPEKPQKYDDGEKARKYDARRDKNEKAIRVEGVLEILNDGYGFLRGENYLSSRNDIFISANRIKALRLRTGDQIVGILSDKVEENKARQIEQVISINGYSIHDSMRRKVFERMTPIYPTERLKMETKPENIGGRMIDLLSPIGKGQRGLIISPPKAGKTTLLKSIARSIQENNPDIHLIILLIDERPEEVTDFKDFVIDHNVEVVYSTFDEEPEHHRRVAEMAIERAKSIVQHGDDVVILLDSITRLARTYNLLAPNSGKILSGGLDPTSLYYPKHFFGAARNTREGGSLTILATALIDTGSRMDEVIFEEFKGTGNMELVLSRDMAQKRIFPAIDVIKSGTRKEELLLQPAELNAAEMIRNHAVPLKEHANEDIIKNMKVAQDNDSLVKLLNQSKPVSQA